jgi:hypothetical protein
MAQTVEVRAKYVDQISGPVAKSAKSTKASFVGMSKAGSALKGVIGGLAASFGGLLILSKVNAVLKESTDLYKRQLQAETALTAALGHSSQALLDHASALQKNTTFGDEAIIEAQALVAAFIKEEDQIKSLMPAILDLAAAKGMDLRAAADLVTKSVASSTNALARYGIEIDGAAGSAERTTSTVDALTKAFGGMAQALADTDVGKLEQMENTLGDIKEQLGENLLPLQVQWNELILTTVQYWSQLFGLVESTTTFTDVREALETQKQTVVFIKQALDLERKRNDNSKDFFEVEQRFFAALKLRNALQKEFDALIDKARPSNQPAGSPNKVIKGKGGTPDDTGFFGPVDITVQVEAFNELASAESEFIDAHLLSSEFFIDSERRKTEALEEEGALRIQLTEQELANIQEFTQSFAGNVGQIFTDLTQARINNIERERKKEVDAIKTSKKTSKQKEKLIEEVNKKAEEERKRMANIQKTVAIGESLVNTAQGITAALKLGAVGIPLSFIIGAMGAAQIALIASQSFARGGIVQGPSQGDNVLVRANGGEGLFTLAQQARLFAIANGEGVGGPSVSNQVSITINADVDDATWAERQRQLLEALDELSFSGQR